MNQIIPKNPRKDPTERVLCTPSGVLSKYRKQNPGKKLPQDKKMARAYQQAESSRRGRALLTHDLADPGRSGSHLQGNPVCPKRGGGDLY